METFSFQQSLNIRRAELGLYIHEGGFQKIVKISAIVAGFILLFGITTFSVRGFFVKKAVPDLSPAMLAVAGGPTKTVMTGVNIANNGAVFISGALVSEISSDVIKASVSWGDVDFVWTIQTNQSTKFLNYQGKKQTISDIKVGDIVNVTGKLVGDSGQFVVNANFVRN